MNVHVSFGVDEEVERVKHTLEKSDWYRAKGYHPRLPDGISPTSSDEEIRRAVADGYDEASYAAVAEEVRRAFEEHGERLARAIRETLRTVMPETIRVRLTRFGVNGSYELPDRIVFNVHSKDLARVLFHETVHLAIEPSILRHGIAQWDKERVVDLILHAEPFAFLGPSFWQMDYHGAEARVDPLFGTLFSDREKFFADLAASARTA